MDASEVRKYFEEHAESWVLDGYGDDGYNYPVPLHRARIVLETMQRELKAGRIADLGCGGGNLSLLLAEAGYEVVGVDQSDKMHALANRALEASPHLAQRVRFEQRSLDAHGLEPAGFDAVVAMGLIGYLGSDDVLFRVAKDVLKPRALFLVSCRNRLFNMTSPTQRTVREIESGAAPELIAEIQKLVGEIPGDAAQRSVERFNDLSLTVSVAAEARLAPSEKQGRAAPGRFEARQQTPREMRQAADRHGFEVLEFVGVHPHVMLPAVNRLLPPQVYNRLSACLEPLERLPVSLAWSSVFIGVFRSR